MPLNVPFCFPSLYALMLQGVQDHIDGLAAELGKSLKKELHESSAVCQAQFAELCKQLADKKAQITAKTEVYQQVRACPQPMSMLSECHAKLVYVLLFVVWSVILCL